MPRKKKEVSEPVDERLADQQKMTAEIAQEQKSPTELPQHYERIDIAHIEISGDNPRKDFNEEELGDLRESVREHGIIEPLIVRPVGGKDSSRYELVAGGTSSPGRQGPRPHLGPVRDQGARPRHRGI